MRSCSFEEPSCEEIQKTLQRPATLGGAEDADSDDSLPQPDPQAAHKGRHDSDSDLSPQRPAAANDFPKRSDPPSNAHQERRTTSEKDSRRRSSHHRSPPRRGRHDSSDDRSPPRKKPSSMKPSHSEKVSGRRHERSPQRQQSSSNASRSRCEPEAKHAKRQTNSHRGSLAEKPDSAVRVKIEPLDDEDGVRGRPKGGGRKREGTVSPVRGNSDSDLSPERARSGKGGYHDPNHGVSPPMLRRGEGRNQHHSPKRKQIKVKVEPASSEKCTGESPHKNNSDSDLSPRRPTRRKSGGADHSPQRRNRRLGGTTSSRRHDSDSDLSPPRPGKDSELPPKPNKRDPSDSDLSPVRAKSPESDLSPPRARPQASRDVRGRNVREHSTGKGKRKESEKTQEIVKLRDTSKADRAKEAAAKEAERKKIYDKWGKGLAQQEQQAANLEEHLHEMSKPFSRYEGDLDLEKHLKEQEREGDPMLNYIRKKKKKGAESSMYDMLNVLSFLRLLHARVSWRNVVFMLLQIVTIIVSSNLCLLVQLVLGNNLILT